VEVRAVALAVMDVLLLLTDESIDQGVVRGKAEKLWM
jgi:hypothetical protein